MLVPLAYIDLDEYIKSLQDALNDKRKPSWSNDGKRKQNDKQLRKIAELDNQIEHDKKNSYKQANYVRQMAKSWIWHQEFSLQIHMKWITSLEVHLKNIIIIWDHIWCIGIWWTIASNTDMIDIIFMVYLVILQRTVKIMVFIALKRGFNVYIEELIGDFYKPINKVKYWLFNTLNTIRKNVKK